MTQMSQLADSDFRAAVKNIFKDLKEDIQKTNSYLGNFSWEIENIKNEPMEIPKLENLLDEGLTSDGWQQKKESLNLEDQ